MRKTRTPWQTWTVLCILAVFLLVTGASLSGNIGSLVNADGTDSGQVHICIDSGSGEVRIATNGEGCNENWPGIGWARSSPEDGLDADRLPGEESGEFTAVDPDQDRSSSSYGKPGYNFNRIFGFGLGTRTIPGAKSGSRGEDGGKCQANGQRRNKGKCRGEKGNGGRGGDGKKGGDGDGNGYGGGSGGDGGGGGGEPPVSENNFWALTGNAETDPLTNFLGTTGDQPIIFKTNGSEAFRVGAEGNLGIGTETPADRLHVSNGNILLDGGGYNFAPAGEQNADLAFFRGGTPADGLFIAKRFGPDHTIFHINSPPENLGANEATLSLVRGDEPNLELVDFYNNGYSTETQYGIRMIKNGGGEFRDFVFDYFDRDQTATKREAMRITPSLNVGIRRPDPQSALHVSGYVQLDLSPGIPPAEDCDDESELGRMKVDDSGSGALYVCIRVDTSIQWNAIVSQPPGAGVPGE